MNEQIRIAQVRLVDEHGEMVGEIDTVEAKRMALEAGLDLVEVSPGARPPVCRIMDHGKYQYQRKKKQSGGPTHRNQLKQIRLRAKTGQHDIDFKVQQARKFLERRDKVKINVLFRGRENAHHDRGREMLQEITETLSDVASVDRAPSMESRRMMTVVLSPKGA